MRTFLTIGELRKRLDSLEARWTEEDDRYMGRFEDQHVMVPVYQKEPDSHLSAFKGYSPEVTVFWDVTGLGLLIEDDADGRIREALKTTTQAY